MVMTNEELRDSLVKLWDAHTALKVEFREHDSWARTRSKEYDRKMEGLDKSIRILVGEVGTLKIVTAIAKVRLSLLLVMSNAIGGAITLALFWIAKGLSGGK